MLEAKIELNRAAPVTDRGSAADRAPAADRPPASDCESGPPTSHEPPSSVSPRTGTERPPSPGFRRIIAVSITLVSVAIAVILGRATWRAYVETPWTRDGT